MDSPSNGHARIDPGRARPENMRRSERGEEAFLRAERHSRRVRRLKFVLPAAAAILAVVFVGYSFLASGSRSGLDIIKTSIENGAVVMANPELNGFTGDNLPYSLTADRARQPLGDSDIIELEGIHANVPVDADKFADITAASGTYNRGENKIDIDSELILKISSGITARLQSAKVDIDSNSLTTSKPVKVELDGTEIAADSFAATEGGKVFVFKERVRVTIDPSRVRHEAPN